ncbi:hypothetical protein [Deinococcus hopiensis]|uniref:Uncharacterized protein n=1 Tax=Deinococcus hopiensis KR-140 TaxID=695939 RepID=A0A1W1UJ57_9DEIO|nr:hypothetical protein [Deinococcus hopiensis]SMB81110.1 hypothetical protein SAMN00790413_04465 [Deinococcus hopiensis KR-140]
MSVRLPLLLPDLWSPRTVRVLLIFGDRILNIREVEYAPRQNVRGHLQHLLVQGIGWARRVPSGTPS